MKSISSCEACDYAPGYSDRLTSFARHASRVTRHGFAALSGLLACAVAVAATAIPSLTAPVTDLTGTLTQDQIASLNQSLLAFADRKGSQVAVLIVPTVEPESIEQYSMRVVESWKLGRKDIDDGVLFLIAKNDRTMRIEVGKGLEGALPDVIAKRIIRDEVTPHFRAGDFYLGIVAGVDRITRVINGEPLPQPTVTERVRKPGSNLGSIFPVLLMGGFFVARMLRALFGRFVGASLAAAGAGIIVWFVVGVLVVSFLAALIAFVLTIVGGGGGGMSSGRRWGGHRHHGRFGGFGGGFGGGGFGGGGGGFGGFGGGGGSFGGGGASGRW